MIAELEPPDRLGEVGFRPRQSKAMVVGIDDLLVKSMATFRAEMRALKYVQTSTLIAILIGFAGLLVAILTRA